MNRHTLPLGGGGGGGECPLPLRGVGGRILLLGGGAPYLGRGCGVWGGGDAAKCLSVAQTYTGWIGQCYAQH